MFVRLTFRVGIFNYYFSIVELFIFEADYIKCLAFILGLFIVLLKLNEKTIEIAFTLFRMFIDITKVLMKKSKRSFHIIVPIEHLQFLLGAPSL